MPTETKPTTAVQEPEKSKQNPMDKLKQKLLLAVVDAFASVEGGNGDKEKDEKVSQKIEQAIATKKLVTQPEQIPKKKGTFYSEQDPRLKPHLTVKDLYTAIDRWFEDFKTNMSMFGDVLANENDPCWGDFVKKTIELYCDDFGEVIDESFETFYKHSGYNPQQVAA